MIPLLASTPFIRPMNVFHDWWYLLIVPLALGISLIYKALRMSDLDRYWWSVATMTIHIVVGMIGLGLALLILVQLIIPALPVD